jgi:hypothetical protein
MSETGVTLEAVLVLAEALSRLESCKFTSDIRDFQEKFGLLPKHPGPQFLEPLWSSQRIGHLREEVEEYVKANTLEEKLDALVDIVYVALGTACMHGFNFDEAWRRVHNANMLKTRKFHGPKQGITKPADWQKPDLRDLVKETDNGATTGQSEGGGSGYTNGVTKVGGELPPKPPLRPESPAEIRSGILSGVPNPSMEGDPFSV